MNTTGILEVILYVENIHDQACFYRDVIGFPVIMPTGKEDYSQEYWIELGAGGCTLALHGGGKRRFGEDAPKIVFAVEDIEFSRLDLIDKGIEVGEIRSPAPGVYVCDFRYPEGNWLSIEQRSVPSL